MARTVATLRFDRLPELQGKLRQRASQITRKAALDIEAHAKSAMAEPKSGHVYKRGTATHQASAPGEAPAIDMGALVNSIQTEQEESVVQVVFTNQRYAPHLEFGTSRIAPRPFLGPAAEAVRPGYVKAMESLLE